MQSQRKAPTAREQTRPGRYDPVRHAAILLAARDRAAISGNPTPDPHHKRQGFRPSDMNRLLGRVEFAKTDLLKPVTDLPPPAPTPAPAAKGGKGAAAKAGAFLSAMWEMMPPPPKGAVRPSTYSPSLSIGGRRPEPE